ncbi:MAG: ribonuclease J [Armatimonadetes bacterium]|nr:ribonuclease J [Armatimonadota bacterium]
MPCVKIVPLGGCGEIGKNCTVVEQGDDLIVIDVGLAFPHEEHYGVDIVVPDFTYLIENKDRLRGIFLTHAHEDHVGALSFLLPQVSCPVYATPFTSALVRSKLEERTHLKDVGIETVQPGDTVTVGDLSVEFVRVTHSIPETCALAVHTVHGIVLFTADFKFDFTPVDGKLSNISRLTELGQEGVVLLLSDSTNIDRPGWGPSESRVTEGLRKVVQNAPGRVFVTMFASNIHRMQQAIDVAVETGRKVAVTGRRMEQTIDIARRLQYLRMPEGVYVKLDEIGKHASHELLVLTTGSQGEPMAALSQMSRNEYSRARVVEGDTIVYSARPIPGNEGAIWRTVNRLFKMGANVVTDSDSPIHVSGHAYQEEIKMMVNLVRPFYIAPVHGEPRHQHIFKNLAEAMGWPSHRIFEMSNGDVLVIDDDKAGFDGTVAHGEVLIDQHGNVPVTDEVLGQRASLGHDGVVVVSVGLDTEEGGLVGRPEAQIRGFSGPVDVVEDALDEVCTAMAKLVPNEIRDVDKVRATILETVRRTINRRCQQRPVVVAAVVELD